MRYRRKKGEKNSSDVPISHRGEREWKKGRVKFVRNGWSAESTARKRGRRGRARRYNLYVGRKEEKKEIQISTRAKGIGPCKGEEGEGEIPPFAPDGGRESTL